MRSWVSCIFLVSRMNKRLPDSRPLVRAETDTCRLWNIASNKRSNSRYRFDSFFVFGGICSCFCNKPVFCTFAIFVHKTKRSMLKQTCYSMSTDNVVTNQQLCGVNKLETHQFFFKNATLTDISVVNAP